MQSDLTIQIFTPTIIIALDVYNLQCQTDPPPPVKIDNNSMENIDKLVDFVKRVEGGMSTQLMANLKSAAFDGKLNRHSPKHTQFNTR